MTASPRTLRAPATRWPTLPLALRSTRLAALLPSLLLAASLAQPVAALAQAAPAAVAGPTWQAGLRTITVPASASGAPAIPVALFYPTLAPARSIAMGPFSVQVAMQAAPEATVKGLILLSHGTGGSELGHASLAQALARAGYLVAALRHPGDDWQDRSLLRTSPTRYFDERPRQASRVIDAVLADPAWGPRIRSDARGPRIGALGHSAGGYTVLALAGGLPEQPRIAAHCAAHRSEDPIFCSLGDGLPPASAAPAAPGTAAGATTPAAPTTVLRDPRVRAVVALSPMGVVFNAASLAAIRVPTAVYTAALDRYLVPRFHGDWINGNLPAASRQPVANAWHFAFMDTPSMAIPSEDGDLRADPPGFDRAAFLQQLGQALPLFFDQAWD